MEINPTPAPVVGAPAPARKPRIPNRTGRRSTCIQCGHRIVEVSPAPAEYVEMYYDDSEAWVDTTEGRALCYANEYRTAHVSPSEWSA
jgi:hypothetical protein